MVQLAFITSLASWLLQLMRLCQPCSVISVIGSIRVQVVHLTCSVMDIQGIVSKEDETNNTISRNCKSTSFLA